MSLIVLVLPIVSIENAFEKELGKCGKKVIKKSLQSFMECGKPIYMVLGCR
ncbi:MAG: hypothetical protein QXT53_07105 [Ignisphaera sp.]